MPTYEYLCDGCGPFTAMRPMAEFELPLECPVCDAMAPRVILTAPHCSTTSAEGRQSQEWSATSPAATSHASGCGCCSSPTPRFSARAKGSGKSFSTSRAR
jgi:putative FmdB family regulatory protein